jgi:hypothetical protein
MNTQVRVAVALSAAFLMLAASIMLGPHVSAQSGPPSLGSVTVSTTALSSCPTYTTSSGTVSFYSGMTCYDGSEAGCPNTADTTTNPFPFVVGYAKPTTGTVNGTIVFLSGGDGNTPTLDPGSENNFADDYFKAGYQVVQIAWGTPEGPITPWEDNGLAASAKNVGYAACRPASFLSWVYNNLYLPIQHNLSKAGMCAQGTSAGSAAIAYSLAWYAAGAGTNSDLLDKVELLSGPVLSDIEQGCAVYPFSESVTVCPSVNGVQQFGCNPANSPSSWSLEPYYTGAVVGVRGWTGDNSCRNGNYTSSASNENWKDMSIVDDGVYGHFSYPNTSMSAWLCSSVYTGDGDNDDTPNNSSPQGELFYAQITGSSQVGKLYRINGVTNCDTSEGVAGQNATAPGGVAGSGYSAIKTDMLTGTDGTNGCVHPQTQ